MASRFTSKQKSSDITTIIFWSNKYMEKRKRKEKRIRIGAEKQSSKYKPTWIYSERYNPKVGDKASTTTRKRKNEQN